MPHSLKQMLNEPIAHYGAVLPETRSKDWFQGKKAINDGHGISGGCKHCKSKWVVVMSLQEEDIRTLKPGFKSFFCRGGRWSVINLIDC